MSEYEDYRNFRQIEQFVPLTGHRRFVSYTYMSINFFGFVVNCWVLYVIVPVLFFRNANVPKSILLYILVLCISDLMTMIAMVFLNLDIIFGTWCFSEYACTAYLLFESVNKFVAPIIVLLMSHTCYASICLDVRHQQRAACAQRAAIKVLVVIAFVVIMILPVFYYSHVHTVFFNVDETKMQVSYVKKCSYTPPNEVEVLFNFVVCVVSYIIPFCGFLYWYVSVPYFLWKRKSRANASNKKVAAEPQSSTTLHTPDISSANCSAVDSTPMVVKIPDAVIRKVVLTVLILSLTYLLCWTPYWVGLYVVLFFQINMTKSVVITMYFVHLLPYISCAAYPFIFTVMNRAIQSAHTQLVNAQKRRLRNFMGRTWRCLLDTLTCNGRLLECSRSRFCSDSIADTLNNAGDSWRCRKQQFGFANCDIKRSSLSATTRGATAENGALLGTGDSKPVNVVNKTRFCCFDFCTPPPPTLNCTSTRQSTSNAFHPLQYGELCAIDSTLETEHSASVS